jgi:glycosyltransferase involved in cell wall biosynthesis
VANRVIWRGQVSQAELIGAYHAATALWFPSNARSEGFGLVQVEALASGCPVINTALAGSGVPWVSPHEQSGLTVPVNDASAFAAAARRLLVEPGLRVRLAAGARQRACREFDHLLMARRSLDVYRDVVEANESQALRRQLHAREQIYQGEP